MKKFILLLVAVLASLSMWAETKYIAEVMLIGGTKSETDELKDTYMDQGWTVIDQDLNAGCGSSSDYIYLLYKEGSTASPNHTFVTDFLLSNASGTAPDTRDAYGHRYRLHRFRKLRSLSSPKDTLRQVQAGAGGCKCASLSVEGVNDKSCGRPPLLG